MVVSHGCLSHHRRMFARGMETEITSAHNVVLSVPAEENMPLFPTSRSSSRSFEVAFEEPSERTFFGPCLRKPWLMFELLVIAILSTSVAHSVSIPFLRQKTFGRVSLWKWEISLLVAVVSRHISSIITRVLWIFLMAILKSRNSLGYFLNAIRRDVCFFVTWVIVNIPLYIWFSSDELPSAVLRFLIKAAASSLILSSVSFVISIMLTALAAWFHVTTYHKWVDECLFNWSVIKSLSGEPWMSSVFDLSKTSSWDMKKMIISGKVGLCVRFKTEAEAKVAATKIFPRVAKPGSAFVDLEDITRFLPRADALKFMILFPRSSESEASQISASLLEKWMVHAFKHEKNLVMSMKTMDATASKAHTVVKVTCWIVQAIMFFPLTGLVGTWVLQLLTPTFVLVAFLFGNTWKSVTDSLLFVFVQHPFDIGDRINIDENEFVVDDIQVLSSTFIGVDKVTVEFTNVELWTRSIKNFTKCARKREGEAPAAASNNN